MNQLTSFKVSSVKTATAEVEVPVNHIVIIDCSGSMWDDLPLIREQLKNKLPSLLKEDDTISIVWFSSKGEFGILVKKVHVKNLVELKQLNNAIDRWLKPMGCTGFVEPLNAVKELVDDDKVYSMLFLTDGCDNEWEDSEIYGACEAIKPLLSNAVFVEYGFYCDHKRLTEMANRIDGTLIFNEDFQDYELGFENFCKRKVTNKRIEVEVGSPALGFVWSVGDSGAVSYKVEDGKVHVPEDVDEIFWFTNDDVPATDKMNWKALYQGISALAMNRESEFVKKQLSDIGDVRLFNKYVNAFSKMNLYDCVAAMNAAGEDPKLRFTEGKKVGLKPKEDAFTVLQVLSTLQEAGALIRTDAMNYSRIGRAVKATDELTKSQAEELGNAISESDSVSQIKEHTNKAVKLAKERSELTFTANTPYVKINDFTYHKNRSNVSMLLTYDGTVPLPSDAPSTLPSKFPTKIYRNYAVLRDGMVNIPQLPVVIPQATVDKLIAKGVNVTVEKPAIRSTTPSSVIFSTPNPVSCVIDLRSLPVINAKMVKSVSAKEFAERVYQHMQAQASGKVYKGFLDELEPAEKSAGIKDKYGEECAEYLKALGITDSGFSQNVRQTPATDKYNAFEFNVAFKGLSKIPSFNEFKKKLTSGKFNAGDMLLKPAYDECVAKKASMSEKDFIAWLKTSIKTAKKKEETLYDQIIEDKFSLIIGQSWFNDLSTEENTIVCNGMDVTFEMKDTVVEL